MAMNVPERDVLSGQSLKAKDMMTLPLAEYLDHGGSAEIKKSTYFPTEIIWYR